MNKEEKVVYLISLLSDFGLKEEDKQKASIFSMQKEESEIEDLILKIQKYYETKNTLDQQFLNDLNKLNNNIDETIERILENSNIENINF